MATPEEQKEIALHAMQFKNEVNSLIEDEEERSKLFDALRNYLESRKVKKLVRDLKLVLDNSKKYPLFKEIRAFIPPEHLFAFDKLTEGARTGERIIHLKRHGNESLGFKFKGGLEHGIGIYVTSIIPGSAAHASGLRIGDEILKVNGFVLHESIHDEVVNVLKSKKSLTFVTKNMGKIPNKVNNRIVWQEVDPNMKISPSVLVDPKFRTFSLDDNTEVPRNDDRFLAFKIGREGLGCSILSGIENFEGVFVSAVSPNMLADQVGLKVGDQILQVNGRIFDKIKHSEAVDALKSRKDLTMIVRHNENVAEYLRRKSKQKLEALHPILVTEGVSREIKKKASFGEEPLVEYIERQEEDELSDDEEDDLHGASSEPGQGNFQYDESITQGKDVHFVAILKTAPLMLDLEVRNDLVVVRNALKGGSAAEHGFLKRGDIILNVEGTDLIGCDPVEAQEAISEAMGRLSQHIDMVVACPPGRKPPLPQDVANTSLMRDNQSNTSTSKDSTDKETEETAEEKSAVARAIAQFESKSPKRTAFLLRRDSLEKVSNSLRLYKEKKRAPVARSIAPAANANWASGSRQVEARSFEGQQSSSSGDMAYSLDQSQSPSMSKRPAFSMNDPKPVTYTNGNRTGGFDVVVREPKEKWASAVRKVSISFKETKSASNENFHQAPAQNPPIAGNSINSPSPKSLQNFDHTSLNSNTTRRDSGGVTSQPPNESLLKINDVKQREPVMQTQVANKPSPLSSRVTYSAEIIMQKGLDSVPLSDTQIQVQAQVHSPPPMSNDDILKTWAPTSPARGHSTSNENLSPKRSVAFDKEVTEIIHGQSQLSPTSRSLSLDELNERVEKRDRNGSREKEARQERKKSVGFRDTVERIEPIESLSYKSLDDISMIGKNGWDERMKKYARKEKEQHNLQPKKSALRNSPSPRLSHEVISPNGSHGSGSHGSGSHGSDYYDSGHQDSDRHRPESRPSATVPRGSKYSPAHRSDSSKKKPRLLPSNSLDDDPSFNEEIDKLAHSLDPSIVIPVPDYDGASETATALPSTSHKHSKPRAPPPPAAQVVKPKKSNHQLGLTNRLLSNAKEKLKRVGFKRTSQSASSNKTSEAVDKPSNVSKASSSIPPQPPPQPPPPPPPPPVDPQGSSPSPRDSSLQPIAPMQYALTNNSPSPPPGDTSLSQLILNSPVRKAAASRNYEDLERRRGSQPRSDDSLKTDSLSMRPAIASEVTEDVKVASVVDSKDSNPRQKPNRGAKYVDMTDVLSELKGKVRNKEAKARPISIHSDRPTNHATSYSNRQENRMQNESEPAARESDAASFQWPSLEASPSKPSQDSRESRILRRQAQSVADVDTEQLDVARGGLMTPRSARSDKNFNGKDGAVLEMEGTLKEFDEVIRSLDTEL